MAIYRLNNLQLSVCVDSVGAELKSLKKINGGTEYMWDANPEYWERTSPVLFPFVGSLNNGSYRYDGKEYPMPKHGFAKDMEFDLLRQTENELSFLLRADQETKLKYPFDFELVLGYRFDKDNDNKLIVSWKVTNHDSREMYFSIGGHPAFLYPDNSKDVQTKCKVLFDIEDKIISSVVGKGSLFSTRTREFVLQDGMMDITADMFDEDALVIEHDQAHKVSLCNDSGQPYLTVSFDAPLFALWSPAKKNAPFICIEPWYGRGDRENFTGDLSEREYGNKLAPSDVFYAEYTIMV